MRICHLVNTIGNPTDTTVAIGTLIYGGVVERLPKLNFCFSHGGGSMPYLIGRHDHSYSVRPECKSAIPKPPGEYFRRLYFDSIAHSPAGLLFLTQMVGSDRVLLGSDYPTDMADRNPVATVGNLAQISEQDKQKMWGGNAARLLKMEK